MLKKEAIRYVRVHTGSQAERKTDLLAKTNERVVRKQWLCLDYYGKAKLVQAEVETTQN